MIDSQILYNPLKFSLFLHSTFLILKQKMQQNNQKKQSIPNRPSDNLFAELDILMTNFIKDYVLITEKAHKNYKQKMIVPKDQQIQALLGQRALQQPTLFCGKGHKIERFCFNPACKFDSLCCDEDSCALCESQHQTCFFKKLKYLSKAVQERLSLHTKVMRRLFVIENELINKLMANRKKIIEQSKGFGAGNYSSVIDAIYFENNTKGLKGKEMKELFFELSEINIEKEADQYLQSYKAEGEGMISKLEILRNDLIENLGLKKKEMQKNQEPKIKIENKEEVKIKQNTQILSKILAEDEQGKQKYSFLMKQLNNPTQLKLLFRASQHNFSAPKFHEICDGISDTLTIVRTHFGKTIAAFTPLKWSIVTQSKYGEYVADDSNRSFLLQLDLKQKMTLINPQYAIHNCQNNGPVFGANDLFLSDKCNQNQKSCSYFPFSYNCNGKYQQNQQSYSAFCGNPSGWFRVIEYQVFVVCK